MFVLRLPWVLGPGGWWIFYGNGKLRGGDLERAGSSASDGAAGSDEQQVLAMSSHPGKAARPA